MMKAIPRNAEIISDATIYFAFSELFSAITKHRSRISINRTAIETNLATTAGFELLKVFMIIIKFISLEIFKLILTFIYFLNTETMLRKVQTRCGKRQNFYHEIEHPTSKNDENSVIRPPTCHPYSSYKNMRS